ncbi:Uncharacterized protein TCM_018509 [Theobroma cacao]|uniref:Uncharacterized protein n=1 Tax=Theobroma cacao TaxID=3641 RepID=A0A061EM96_THECC|nr:Uncharacterized protein TCM_018509 [Theobroma cacao]
MGSLDRGGVAIRPPHPGEVLNRHESMTSGKFTFTHCFEFIQNDKLIFIHQKKFKMDACKPVSAPMVLQRAIGLGVWMTPRAHQDLFSHLRAEFSLEILKAGAVKGKEIEVCYCCSSNQLADMMTKRLPTDKFPALRSKMGVFNIDLKETVARDAAMKWTWPTIFFFCVLANQAIML